MMATESEGLVTLPVTEFAEAALQSLTVGTVVVLNNTYQTMPKAFLLKQWRYMGSVKLLHVGDAFLIGLQKGGATTTEVEEALEVTVVDVEDASTFGLYAEKNRVIWNSLVQIPAHGVVLDTTNSSVAIDTGWMSMGRKGMPFHEEQGPVVIAYNNGGAALQADVEMDGLMIFRGVFLNG